jgi:predicted nucleic acid-binding protein
MMRAVFDRNVLVSAAIAPNGTCAELLETARSGQVEVLLTPRLMDELTGVLVDRLDAADAGRFVWRLRGAGTLVNDPHPSWPAGGLDPGSAHVVAVARERGAGIVVSGHGGLLRAPVEGIRILSPAAMLDHLATTRRIPSGAGRSRAAPVSRANPGAGREMGIGP